MGLFSKSFSGGTGGGYSGGSVTAAQMRQAFERHMDSEGIKYTVLDEDDSIVYLAFGGSRYETFVLVDFDEDMPCTSAHFNSPGFAKILPGKNAEVLVKLNQINKRFRWVKFWADDDGTLTADCDAVLDIDSVGKECLEVSIRLSNIIENALDELKGIAELDADKKMQLSLVAALKKMGGA